MQISHFSKMLVLDGLNLYMVCSLHMQQGVIKSLKLVLEIISHNTVLKLFDSI